MLVSFTIGLLLRIQVLVHLRFLFPFKVMFFFVRNFSNYDGFIIVKYFLIGNDYSRILYFQI